MSLGLTQHPLAGTSTASKEERKLLGGSWGNVGGLVEVQMPPTHAEPSGGEPERFRFTLSHSCAKLLLGKK